MAPEAIATLVSGHREFLAFLERRVESRAAAEDILQGAFARALERGTGGRLDTMNASGNPGFEKLTERNLQSLDVLLEVAAQLGPADGALNRLANQPAFPA